MSRDIDRMLHGKAYWFMSEFLSKFRRRAKERKRSLQPWKDFAFIELFERLEEEVEKCK